MCNMRRDTITERSSLCTFCGALKLPSLESSGPLLMSKHRLHLEDTFRLFMMSLRRLDLESTIATEAAST